METVNLFGLTPEQGLIRESVLDLLGRVLPRERIRAMDKACEYPAEAYQALADGGWMGLLYPEKYGGMGGSYKDFAVLAEAISYHYAGVAQAYLVSAIYGASHIFKNGNEAQRSHFLPRIISGEAKFALGISEPGAGSDVASIETRAVRRGDEYVITGQKLYTTCAHVADYLIVVAKTRPDAGQAGISIFIVDARQPGVTIRPMDMLGRHTSHTNEVFLDEVKTPADWLIGEENKGWHCLMACLNVERLGMAAVGTGNSFKVLDYTLDYAKSRLAFGKPISKFQSIQHKLADMRIMAENARLLTYRVAELIDNGQPCVLETSMAKIVATDANFNCANLGLQIMGGAGYTCAYDMEMFFRDARVGPIGGGSNEIQRNIMAKLLDC